MKTTLFLVLALFVAQTYARCPGTDGACNGKGDCTMNDICVCYSGWQGVGCDDRVCPFAVAWSGFVAQTERPYSECAGRGTCDRVTGECQCNIGFEGKGCARMSCPGNCNGHGTCNLVSVSHDAGVKDAVLTIDHGSEDAYWDQIKIQLCNCDPGYEGHDCSLKRCPRGDDPMTAGTAKPSWEFHLNDGAGTDFVYADLTDDAEHFFEFTDWRGNLWHTRPIKVRDMTVTSVKELFENIPNRAVPEVAVTLNGNGDTFDLEFQQPITNLKARTTACITAGCQPLTVGATSSNFSANKKITINYTAGDADSEFAVCSNRGSCDSVSGLCVCESGYYGEACSGQTTVR